MSYLVFDIETGPLSDSRLREIFPGFNAKSFSHPGEFDSKKVKLGNLKDESKIQEKIDDARSKHEAAVANYQSELQAAEDNYWAEIFDRAALSATSGQILVIGYQSEKGVFVHGVTEEISEKDLIVEFWKSYERIRSSDRQMTGFCIKEFDVPFIAQRSVIHGIPVPRTLIQNGRFLSSTFVDLRDVWAFGGRPSGSLDLVCKSLGIQGKLEGVNGAMFAELYCNLETRPKAIEYSERDLAIEFELAERLLG